MLKIQIGFKNKTRVEEKRKVGYDVKIGSEENGTGNNDGNEAMERRMKIDARFRKRKRKKIKKNSIRIET